MKKLLIVVILFLLVSACTPTKQATGYELILTPKPTSTTGPSKPATVSGECDLAPIVVPTMPAEIPGYIEVDPATGLHMTGKPLQVDFAAYRLSITGLVDHPLSFTYDQLRCMPKVTATPSLICEGFFVDLTTWSGVPLKYLLDLVGIQSNASDIKLISADGYSLKINIADAMKDENFLAYEWMGQPIPVLHGFPLRAVFPSLTGYNWVKWLVEIVVE